MTTGAPIPPFSSASASPSGPAVPGRPRRSRLLRFLPLGTVAWLVLEVWLLTLVAGAASGFAVLLLLVAGFVLGSVVIKRAGRRAFRALSETLQRQQRDGVPPQGRRNSEGNGLMMLGGLLLMLPGLVSDVVGLLLLVPPVQKAVGRYAERTFERKVREATGSFGDAFQQARIHRPDGKVVPGEVIRDDAARDRGEDPGARPPLTN